MLSFDPPIYINVRDRLRDLRKLVEFLEHAGHERIYLVDNASTWPPLLEYLEQTPHAVVKLGENYGARSIWHREFASSPLDEWFVFTDPDVVPIEECPLDAVECLKDSLDHYTQFQKAGLGLYLEDVPPQMNSLVWERMLVHDGPVPIPGGPSFALRPGVYSSLVDTTFALHRPGTPHMLPAIRTGFPYQMRHSSWYIREPDQEDAYYLAHATPGPLGSSWAEGHQRLVA